MNLRHSISYLAITALLSASGCAFITRLTTAGGADAAAFTVDLEKYSIKHLSLATEPAKSSLCPGAEIFVHLKAEALELKGSKTVTLETAALNASAEDSRGKMDPTEFVMAARGGSITDGVFASNPEIFATLLGFDIRATYRLDTSKEVVQHFTPDYSCFRVAGLPGPEGNSGSSGSQGSSSGGAGSMGGPGGAGGPGPEVIAVVTIVQTPLYERVGLVHISPTDKLTLFDLDTGLTVTARGGRGGRGGHGGRGGEGSKPQGSGGPGGSGGIGASGGPGGRLLLVLDERYPELADIVGIDVAGGSPGNAGMGGSGGSGSPAYNACSGCPLTPAGAKGPGGPSGSPGNISGPEGNAETRHENVKEHFTGLPEGIRLLDD